jgi:hypothetical protein
MLEHGRIVKSTGKEYSLGPVVTSMLEHGRMINIAGKEQRLLPMGQTGPGNERTAKKKEMDEKVWTKNYVGGNQYVGQMKNDTLHGQGTYTWASGHKCVGAWKDDKHTGSGQGTKTWADSNKYVGAWKDGNRHPLGYVEAFNMFVCTYVMNV